MLIEILSLVAGFILLFVGGEGLVRGAVSIATRFGLSTMLVGVVVVGFGTSMPELLVSLEAAFKNTPDIALGNVVGSNIANIILILGVAAVIHPIACTERTIKRDGLAVIIASLVLAGFSFTHALDLMEGVIMITLLVAYLTYSYHSDRKKTQAARDMGDHLKSDFAAHDRLPVALLFAGAGLASLLFGANLLVDSATVLARAAGVSEAVIGLTLVALGTSLPELATAVIASYKKHTDVLIGNVLGSNLFNILSILGITAIVTPIPFAGRIADIDVWFMLAIAVAFLGIVYLRGRITRPVGIIFLLTYVSYCGWLFQTG